MTQADANLPKLSALQKAAALLRVASMSYKSAPSVLYVRIISAVLDSALPIVTIFFAAKTTTALADAYVGVPGAGRAAITYVIITAVLGVVTTAWSSIASHINRMARYKLDAAIGDELVRHFLRLDFWRYDDKYTADLFDRSRRFSAVFSYVFDALGGILTAVATLATSVIALTFVSWWLALLLVVAVIPGVVIQYRLSRARIRHWEGTIRSRRKASNVDWQLKQVSTIAELRLYGLVRHLVGLHRSLIDKDTKQQIIIERGFLGKEQLARTIEALAEVAALIYITFQIIAHTQPIGQFIYVQQVISRGLGSLRQAVQSLTDIDEDLANLDAYNELMGLPVQNVGQVALTDAPSRIELDDVSFQYPGSAAQVLRNVTLQIERGQRVAIVGENGAGKSTLIKLLLGLYLPSRGAVKINDITTADLRLADWHRQVSVLQQEPLQFDFANARDNVIFGDVSQPFSEEHYEESIEKAEAAEFLSKLPQKDKTYIAQWMGGKGDERGVALSGGQKQRLALARSFYRNSPVVILDEPTSSIDALAEARIFKRLFSEKDRTIITVSHRLSTVRRADIIYVLEDGAVVEQGTHNELLKRKKAYFTLFESQL